MDYCLTAVAVKCRLGEGGGERAGVPLKVLEAGADNYAVKRLHLTRVPKGAPAIPPPLSVCMSTLRQSSAPGHPAPVALCSLGGDLVRWSYSCCFHSLSPSALVSQIGDLICVFLSSRDPLCLFPLCSLPLSLSPTHSLLMSLSHGAGVRYK